MRILCSPRVLSPLRTPPDRSSRSRHARNPNRPVLHGVWGWFTSFGYVTAHVSVRVETAVRIVQRARTGAPRLEYAASGHVL